MMTDIVEVEKLLKSYKDWLSDKTTLRQLSGEWVEITTPFLDRHNDALQIYAHAENGGYVLTDDSHILHDLEGSGCNIKTEKRKNLLQMTLNGFGVKMNQDALEVHATAENFPLRKHSLIQAMLAVNDLFYLAKPVIESLFEEDVVAWLDSNEIRYIPKAKFTGTSGYDHLFNFVIPKSRLQPERIVQAINRPSKESAQQFIHAWLDTQHVRPSDAHAYALLNDQSAEGGGPAIPSGVMDAFRNYNIKPVTWRERQQAIEELAA